MSDINDQGPQNLAQAEAEALRALEAGAWRVWQAGSGPLPAAYARWCAAEIELATAALRERIEAAEAEHEDSVVRTNRALRERVEKAEAALAKMTGERDRYCADYMREAARAEKEGADRVLMMTTNFRLVAERDSLKAEVARLRGMMDRAVPYITQTGLGAAIYEAVKREARATPAERAAAGLAPEAPAQPQVIPGKLSGFPWDVDWSGVIDGDAVIYGGRKITFRVEPFSVDPHPAPVQPQQPQVLPEHLAYIEASASAWIDLSCASEQATKAANALRAAVARRDGGQK